MHPAIENVAMELQRQDDEIGKLRSTVAEREARINEDRIDARRQQEEIDRLRAELADSINQRDGLLKDRAEIAKTLKDFAVERNHLQQLLDTERTRGKAELDELKAENAALRLNHSGQYWYDQYKTQVVSVRVCDEKIASLEKELNAARERNRADGAALNEKTAEIERLRGVVKQYQRSDADNSFKHADALKLLEKLMQRAYQRQAYNEADEIAKFIGVPSPIEHELADLKPTTPPKYRDVTLADLGRKDVEFSETADFAKVEIGELASIGQYKGGPVNHPHGYWRRLSDYATTGSMYARVPL